MYIILLGLQSNEKHIKSVNRRFSQKIENKPQPPSFSEFFPALFAAQESEVITCTSLCAQEETGTQFANVHVCGQEERQRKASRKRTCDCSRKCPFENFMFNFHLLVFHRHFGGNQTKSIALQHDSETCRVTLVPSFLGL